MLTTVWMVAAWLLVLLVTPATGWAQLSTRVPAPVEVIAGSPAGTGPVLVRVIGGSPGARVASPTEGIVSQLHAGPWADRTPHAAMNTLMTVPAGANFFPWATSSVISSSASATSAQHVAYFGRAEGSGGAPLWGGAIEVSDTVGSVSAAANLLGWEIATIPNAPGSLARGLDLIAKGTQPSETALVIRAEGAGRWTTAITSPGFSVDGQGVVTGSAYYVQGKKPFTGKLKAGTTLCVTSGLIMGTVC